MNLNTRKPVTQLKVATMPLTTIVIDHINVMARNQGITEIEFHNEKTDSKSPNIDWKCNIDCDDNNKDDCKCDHQGKLQHDCKMPQAKLTNHWQKLPVITLKIKKSHMKTSSTVPNWTHQSCLVTWFLRTMLQLLVAHSASVSCMQTAPWLQTHEMNLFVPHSISH